MSVGAISQLCDARGFCKSGHLPGSEILAWLDPDKPSYTVLAQMDRDLSERIHSSCDRWTTVHEAARLQSFSCGFIFHRSERQQFKQVGNAVPPLLGFAVARVAEGLLATSRVSASV